MYRFDLAVITLQISEAAVSYYLGPHERRQKGDVSLFKVQQLKQVGFSKKVLINSAPCGKNSDICLCANASARDEAEPITTDEKSRSDTSGCICYIHLQPELRYNYLC